ncbi:hypothetical protein JW872_00080 [Candidatus Babeliales bacterium]|nr:hypothetical protein [Candidatus Babeliales bacterium]
MKHKQHDIRTCILFGLLALTSGVNAVVLGISSTKLSPTNPTIFIRNEATKSIEELLVFVRFSGSSQANQTFADGFIKVKNIAPDTDIVINVLEATHPDISGAVASTLDTVEDISIRKIKINPRRTPIHSKITFPLGSHATEFVIKNNGVRYYAEYGPYFNDTLGE